jgi:hypothetical protein
MLDFLCSRCHMQLTVPHDRAGRRVKCPFCAAPVSVPAGRAAPPGARPGPFARARAVGGALAAVLGGLVWYCWAR